MSILLIKIIFGFDAFMALWAVWLYFFAPERRYPDFCEYCLEGKDAYLEPCLFCDGDDTTDSSECA